MWFHKIKIHVLSPWKVIRNSKQRGVSKSKLPKGRYEANLEFPQGGGRGAGFKEIPSVEGVLVIRTWNHTIS